MRTFVRFKRIFGMLIGVLFLSIGPAVQGQGVSSQRGDVTDKELAAFVKVYVQVQKIRSQYEPVLINTQDPKERQKIQQEGDSKVRAALEKQGFAVEKYNKIFAAVNGDGELRKKTLQLIEQERQKA